MNEQHRGAECRMSPSARGQNLSDSDKETILCQVGEWFASQFQEQVRIKYNRREVLAPVPFFSTIHNGSSTPAQVFTFAQAAIQPHW